MKIESILGRREAVANYYYEALQNCGDVITPVRAVENGRVSWFAFVVRLSARFGPTARDQVVQRLTKAGIGCRAYFPPIHLQPLYSGYARAEPKLAVTEDVAARTLALPFFNALPREEVQVVCEVLGATLRRLPDDSYQALA